MNAAITAGPRPYLTAAMAADGGVTDSVERVPGSPADAGEAGAPGVGRIDSNTPGKARDRSGKRAESGAADEHVIDAEENG